MIRRDFSLTAALCASLTLHAVLLGAAAELYTRQFGRHIHLAGFGPAQADTGAPLFIPTDSEDPRDRLGDPDGKGQATDTSPGEQPLAAQKSSQDQPFLSLDPSGPGEVGDEPSESLLPPGKTVAAAPVAMLPPAQAALPLGFGAMPTESAAPTAPSAGADFPGGSVPAADPAPQGESESDPTSIAGVAEFRPGSTAVRLGRKHKITRPHLSIDAQIDLMVLQSPTVVLKIKLDEAGKVTAVDVFRSSGSVSVDQPCKLEAFEWWFEPTKDRNGKPVKDVILFAIRFI